MLEMKKYIDTHTIVRIGNTLHGYLCAETIVDAPMQLIDEIDYSKYFISEIRWWDRVRISSGSKIGYGGPRDPRCPHDYFFAETDICREFNETTKKRQYYEYIVKIKKEFHNYDLHPAFDIAIRCAPIKENPMDNYMYILRCRDGSLYTGWTNDLDRRLQAHQEGRGGKYTHAHRPVELVYFERFDTKQEAMHREWEVKQLTRQEKLRLIETKKA